MPFRALPERPLIGPKMKRALKALFILGPLSTIPGGPSGPSRNRANDPQLRGPEGLLIEDSTSPRWVKNPQVSEGPFKALQKPVALK